MTDSVTKKIIAKCTKIEKDASQLYESFISLTGDKKIQEFWSNMSDEEIEHITFWESLAELAGKSRLPDVLDDPVDEQLNG